jgi:large subunit ribosomal protein L10
VETEGRTPRSEKVAVVDDVRRRLGAASATILTEYRGLSVAELQVLRRALSAAGGDYKVYKNTLVRRAAHDSGLVSLDDLLDGPTALAFVSGDVTAVAKALKEFAKTHPKLVVKGALVGKGLFDAAQTSALADLPSRDVLLAQFAGALAAPLQAFAGLLAALPRKFAYGLSALIEQRGGVVSPRDVAAVEEPDEANAQVGPVAVSAEPATAGAPGQPAGAGAEGVPGAVAAGGPLGADGADPVGS